MNWQNLRILLLTALVAAVVQNGLAASVSQIDTWAAELKSGTLPESATTSITKPEQLRELISKAYVSPESSLKILIDFVASFPVAYLEVPGYEAIFEVMNNTDQVQDTAEILILASHISDLERTSERFSKLEGPARRKLAALKAQFPAVVREIAFGGPKCSFKNKKFGTYLYTAADDFKFDSETRRVFLWSPGSTELSTQEWWTLKTNDKGETWNIKSPHFGGEYLHAFLGLEGQADEDRRRTGTSTTLTEGGTWKLKPENGGEKYMSIWNVDTSEFMYATMSDLEFDHDRRSVYTWIPKPHDAATDDQSLWEVECPKK